MNIKFVKLITGEDLVGDIEEGDVGITIKNPLMLIPTPKNGVAMVSYPIVKIEDKISIYREHVLFVATPGIDLVNFYNQKFGSGLVVPPAKTLEI